MPPRDDETDPVPRPKPRFSTVIRRLHDPARRILHSKGVSASPEVLSTPTSEDTEPPRHRGGFLTRLRLAMGLMSLTPALPFLPPMVVQAQSATPAPTQPVETQFPAINLLDGEVDSIIHDLTEASPERPTAEQSTYARRFVREIVETVSDPVKLAADTAVAKVVDILVDKFLDSLKEKIRTARGEANRSKNPVIEIIADSLEKLVALLEALPTEQWYMAPVPHPDDQPPEYRLRLPQSSIQQLAHSYDCSPARLEALLVVAGYRVTQITEWSAKNPTPSQPVHLTGGEPPVT
jgi:hypothetical protein